MLRLVPVFLAFCLGAVSAERGVDIRLGSTYTSMPLYRSGAGTNVVKVKVGTPEVDMQLTCSTSVDYIVVAATGCEKCAQDATVLDANRSTSLTLSDQAVAYTFSYPAGSSSTMAIQGRFASDILTDERGDQTPRPIVLATSIQTNAASSALGGTGLQLSDRSSGFFGLGVYQDKKANSIIPSMLETNDQGHSSQLSSFTVGFDMGNYSNVADSQAGTIHWGGVPSGSYRGSFNWLQTNTSLGGSWAFDVDHLRIGGDVVDLKGYYGMIDPAFDAVYVPTAVAERIYSKVDGAERDRVDRTRWNLPCNTTLDVKIAISGVQYNIASSELVQARDKAGITCWGSIVAWQNGSLPEQQGEVRLGTPFMAGVYSVLYYSGSAQYVGLAGKPNSVNSGDVSRKEGKPNMQLAGILIGTLLGALILLLLICYGRNRSSFQSVWYRAARRQQRAQMNAMVRAATLPPPIIMPLPMAMGMPMPMHPPMIGPMGMMPRPMAGMVPLVAGASMTVPTPGGMEMGGGTNQLAARAGGVGAGVADCAGVSAPGPPPYQSQVRQNQLQSTQGAHRWAEQQQPLLASGLTPTSFEDGSYSQPVTIEPSRQGYYSPRSLPSSLVGSGIPPRTPQREFNDGHGQLTYSEPTDSQQHGFDGAVTVPTHTRGPIRHPGPRQTSIQYEHQEKPSPLYTAPPPSSEKKRYFAWRDSSAGKGVYQSVLGSQTGRPANSKKWKIWWKRRTRPEAAWGEKAADLEPVYTHHDLRSWSQ
ncbi:hypothetical protein IAU60_003086 [Kwoniella sp. DSM 27419]